MIGFYFVDFIEFLKKLGLFDKFPDLISFNLIKNCIKFYYILIEKIIKNLNGGGEIG